MYLVDLNVTAHYQSITNSSPLIPQYNSPNNSMTELLLNNVIDGDTDAERLKKLPKTTKLGF